MMTYDEKDKVLFSADAFGTFNALNGNLFNDEGALRTLAEEVIAKNPKAVEDFKGGKEKALGALVGQIMKAMKGKANPGMVNELLREMLK